MREQFEELNAQLIEARKTVRERDRILSLMADIDRQLSERRRELSLLVTQLKYEKQDVEALEGMSLAALYYILLGSKEERLAKETAEYLDLKMATEKCRLTIASLEAQLQSFEAELTVLADCDDEHESIKQKRIEFLISLGNEDGEYLAELNTKIAVTTQQQLQDVIEAGNHALKIIAEIESSSPNRSAQLVSALQRSLDDYQNKLKAIAYQHSFGLQAQKSVNNESSHLSVGPLVRPGSGLVVAGLMLWAASGIDISDFVLLPFSHPDLSDWLLHIKNLRSQIVKKMAILDDRLAWLQEEADRIQDKMDELIAEMWQPAYFAEGDTEDRR